MYCRIVCKQLLNLPPISATNRLAAKRVSPRIALQRSPSEWLTKLLQAIYPWQNDYFTTRMKKILFAIALLITIRGAAQITEAYYDYNWKPVSSDKAQYFTLLKKTDSGWYRNDYLISNKQIVRKALYNDSACKTINGTALQYHANGNLSSAEQRKQGKLTGLRLQYYSNGMLMDSAYYENGKQTGTRIFWHRTGYPSDSITRLNDSTLVVVQWFDDGSPAAGGYMVNDRMQGKWQYFHHNGKRSGQVEYDKDKVVRCEYYNEDGSPQTDTAAANREAVFKKKGMEGWRNYLEQNTRWPQGVRLMNVTQVTVTVVFCVNEAGKVTDAEVLLPVHPVFDKEAIKIMEQSPAWLPAIKHNRKIKAWRRQPVTFVQQE